MTREIKVSSEIAYDEMMTKLHEEFGQPVTFVYTDVKGVFLLSLSSLAILIGKGGRGSCVRTISYFSAADLSTHRDPSPSSPLQLRGVEQIVDGEEAFDIAFDTADAVAEKEEKLEGRLEVALKIFRFLFSLVKFSNRKREVKGEGGEPCC